MQSRSIPSVTLYIRLTDEKGKRRYERVNRRNPQGPCAIGGGFAGVAGHLRFVSRCFLLPANGRQTGISRQTW